MKMKQAYNYVKRAMPKDDTRGRLNRLRLDDEKLIASDGFRVHITPVADGSTELDILAKSDKVKIEREEGGESVYPDMQKLIRKADKRDTTTDIVIEAKYLREALTGLKGSVRLVFHGDRHPYEVIGTETYALIMPMNKKAAMNEIEFTPYYTSETT